MVLVYISEAHARDEWPSGTIFSACKQPKRLEDRLRLAAEFVREQQVRIPMLVDNMDNAFETRFAAWPFRYYVLSAPLTDTSKTTRKVLFKAQPSAATLQYDVKSIEPVLRHLLSVS
jgi:hypothetical protein